jgi:hypothetical protein
MSKAEQKANPSHETAGGFIRYWEYKTAFKRSWDRADPEDRIKVKDLPNFDKELFLEISGIDVEASEITPEEGRNK